MTTQIAKKISVKALVGSVSNHIPMKEIEEQKGDKTITKEVPAIGETVWLANVIGLARGIKTGMSNFGEWTALTGEFYAQALVGDKKETRYRTGQLFLPDVALMLVTPIVAGLDKGAAVEVAFKVGITADAESNTGYEYTAAFLVEPAQNDPLAMLAEKVMPQLPSPEKVEEKAPAKAK